MAKLTNLNPPAPIADEDLPASIARDAEYLAADTAHLNTPDPHPQYLLANPAGIEFAQATFNNLDFHTALPAKDFDIRLLASGGGTTNGLGTLLLQAGLFNINAKFSVNGGGELSRLLTKTITVDLPIISAGQIHEVSVSIPNAAAGDIAAFFPTEMPTSLSFFKIMAVISSAGIAKIFFHNLAATSLDVPAFSGRLLVIGF